MGGVAGLNRGTSGQEEDETKLRDSMLGETAESPPQARRNRSGSHADLAGCGGGTEWDSQKWFAAS